MKGLIYKLEVLRSLRGIRPRSCTVCEFEGKFWTVGLPPRYDAMCPKCGLAERHRLLALAFKKLPLVKEGEKLIHFAPEPRIAEYLKSIGTDYVSADLESGRADIVLDLHDLALDTNSVDVALLIHVLEHVDDKRALAEIARVLRPGGRMIAMVPIAEGWPTTYENPEITSPEDRAEHFSQDDHVRWYGRDFRERVQEAGLMLQEFTASGEESVRYSLIRGDVVFIASKPAV